MRYSESFLLFVLCGDFPASVGNFGAGLTARQWTSLCRMLSAADRIPLDLWRGAIDDITPAGETICHRVRHRLGCAEAIWHEWEQLATRGITVCTIADDTYPTPFRERLRTLAPPIFYTAGNRALLENTAIGAVGSRNADEESRQFAAILGAVCAKESLTVVSGGAVGIDTEAVSSALAHGGTAIVCCADRLARQYEEAKIADATIGERALWLSVAHPEASFSAYRALERNRFIYSLAEYTVVVSADANTGGTWSGATDSLRHNWSPLFVRRGEHMRDGCRLLLARADVAGIDAEELAHRDEPLVDWMRAHHPLNRYEQLQLF